MAKFLTYIFCMLIVLAGVHPSFAQIHPDVKAAVNKNQILIGEPVHFSIDVKSPMVSGNELPQFDSIPHFEMIEKGSRDSVVSAEGASYHLEWKLTSFDSGTRYIPSFSIVVGNHIFKTDSLAVEVSYGTVDTTKDYHDIRGIIDIENPNVKYIPWIVGLLTAAALFTFIWFIRKPLNIPAIVTASLLGTSKSPLDDALASLDALKKLNLDDPAMVKKYYSGIQDTLRIFLNRRLGLVTMSKTSEELILPLSGLKMDRDLFSKLSASLRMGDFVKFAKYIPGPFENETNLETVRSAIVIINETGT